jgi:hypothetical protein
MVYFKINEGEWMKIPWEIDSRRDMRLGTPEGEIKEGGKKECERGSRRNSAERVYQKRPHPS